MVTDDLLINETDKQINKLRQKHNLMAKIMCYLKGEKYNGRCH